MTGVVERLRTQLADRYPIERELGEGGMALVYVARDLRYDRRVAIKVLKPEIAECVGADRFLREIEIEARLQHPRILPLLDSGTADGLLYYVMPYVEGETLRQRLQREVQLPIPDVLRIAGQVADALDYAHDRGVVHRDVKPENILLSGDHAFVADFGIARAAHAAGGDWQSPAGTTVWRTETGIAIGTLGYMSPEQAMAAPQIDGRSDQYSLACTVYEMLAGQGETPFPGKSLQIVVAKMISQSPPSVRVVRESVSGLMDEALRRGLAKAPADRFRRCGDFVRALERQATFWDKALDLAQTRTAKGVLAVAVGTIALVVIVDRWDGRTPSLDADTTNYVIFPFDYETGAEERPGEAQRLHDALVRWTGVGVVDRLQLEEALAGGGVPRAQGRAAEVASGLGAGRYVRVAVSPLGADSLRVAATLYDVSARGPPLRSHMVRLPVSLAGADVAYATLADGLLFEEAAPEGTPGNTTTRSLPAAQAFARGERALETWDLASADSGFATASRIDGGYARAHLWLAVVRAWSGADPGRWRVAAEQAALARERLTAREQTMADAVLAHTRGDLERACAMWEEQTRNEPNDYAGWFGWGRCQSRDSIVVPDTRSPSRWSFRTSYHRTLLAYERAFQLRPAILEAQRGAALDSLHALFFTRGNSQRWGHALPPDTTSFRANPTWWSDSLRFVPYPTGTSGAPRPGADAAAWDQAVRRQRQRFHGIALTWAGAYPRSPGALEAVAVSLALIGDAAALDTLASARRLVTDPEERLAMAGEEVWMLVAFGLPFEEGRLRRARDLADSLLAQQPPSRTDNPRLLASLAALRGRATAAAAYVRDPRLADEFAVAPGLRQTAPALRLYSAFGGPADTLLVLERAVILAIERGVPPDARDEAMYQWVGRSASLAFPTYRSEQALRLPQSQQPRLLRLQAAWAAGDTGSVRRGLANRRETLRAFSPEIPTLDVLYAEAALLLELGDARGAAEWLDPTLSVLSRKAPREVTDPVQAASLMRAVALRARLGTLLGDRENAARWGAAIEMLWSDGDEFLGAVVRDLRAN